MFSLDDMSALLNGKLSSGDVITLDCREILFPGSEANVQAALGLFEQRPISAILLRVYIRLYSFCRDKGILFGMTF